MPRSRAIRAAVAGLIALVLGLGFLVFTGSSYQAQTQSCSPTGVMYDPVAIKTGSTPVFKEPEQIKHAQMIISIGLARKHSLRDVKIALKVGMQESNLRNLTVAYDHDSYGIYQQRPSVMGADGKPYWGTREQILDPVYAINRFYEELEKIKNRDNMSEFEVAIAVQRPDRQAYARRWGLWEVPASAFLAGVSATPGVVNVSLPLAGCTGTLGNVEVAVQAALSQVGKPYRWSNQPAGKRFDAAELTQWAYAQAGTVLPATASGQLKAGPAVKKPGTGAWSSVVQRGDLLYWSDGFGGIGRVTMFVGSGKMVNVTSAKAVVTADSVNWTAPLQELVGVTRPIDNNNSGGQHSGWQWPLKSIKVTSPFGMRYHPIKHVWILHEGVDFAAASGTPVFAAKAGTVTNIYTSTGGGKTVTIDHGGGIETEYLHLSGFDTAVGAKVSGGQRIAFSGNSGKYTTGAHLHFNLIENGTNINPITYLKKFGLVP